MEDRTRLHAGNVVAATIPAIVLAIGSTGLGVSLSQPSTVVIWAAILYLPSLAFTVVLSLSIFHVLKRVNLIRWWSASGFGFIGGGLVGWAVLNFRFLRSDIVGLLRYAELGAITAFVVWLFWRSAAAQQNTPSDAEKPRG